MEDPYHSWQPITNCVMGMTISLLTTSVPFIILVEPTHQNYDQGHHGQVRRVQS